MFRWAGLLLVALAPGLLLGQVIVNAGAASTVPPMAPGVAAGTPLLNTPIVSFGTVAPSPVGARNATGNNVAGASNSTLGSVPPVASASQPQVQMTSPYPSVVGAGGEYTVPTGGPATQLPVFDRGAGKFDSVYSGAGEPEGSLGQLARELRQKKTDLNARTYTNADIMRIEQQSGPPGGGVSATAVNAGAAASPAAPATTMPATPAQPTAPPATRPAPPQTAPPPQQEAMAQAPGQAQAGETQQPSAQGQAGQPAQPGASEGRLPPAASQLPTVLLLGAGAIVAGILLRRRNHRRPGVGF